MDLKLFLLVGLCCVLRAASLDRDKAMQAKETGQLRRLSSRFGRNYEMPLTNNELGDAAERQPETLLNEIMNTMPVEPEPGMADTTWHLPLENQLFKYFNRPRRY